MFAKHYSALAFFAIVLAPINALAQDAPNWKFKLTEAGEPSGKAWEDPARISLTVDPNGEDILAPSKF